MRDFVQFFQKRDRFEVLATAKSVRHPLAFVAAVVEIKHRRDRIHAQSIDVKLLEPVERVGEQKITYLVAAVVEDVSAPIRMLAFARIEMLVQRGTVETPERPRVFRKMR